MVNEDTADIVEAVSQRIASIRESINKLKGCRCYHETKEKFETKEVKINETDRTKLRNQFTVRTFDESLDDALPYVNALVKEMKAIREADAFAAETLDSLVDTINKMDTVRLRKGVDVKSDPENPLVSKRIANLPMNVQIGAVMEYLSGAIDGGKDQDQLSVLLARFNDVVDNVKERAMLSKAVSAIKTLMPKLKTQTGETKNVQSEQVEDTFENTFDKYDFDKLFC